MWIKYDNLFMQASSPFYDGNYVSEERPSGPPIQSVTQVTTRDITWFFNQSANALQSLNGDWMVEAAPGLEIISISPAWDGTKHGSMVNPSSDPQQGFDTRMQSNTYSAANNAATGNIDCSTAKSILSAKSYDAAASGNGPQLESVEVLSIVDTLQVGFRPGYSGSDKSFMPVETDLSYAALGSFSKTNVTNKPDISTLADDYARPLIEYRRNWSGRFTHPDLNMPDYGREIGYWLEKATLSLQLDYTNAEKRDLLINIVQMAIDIKSAAESGMQWYADGGHNQGRKGVLLLGAKVLNNNAMLDLCDAATGAHFQDDNQIFTVSQEDVDRTHLAPREGYVSGDIGLSEWGEKHNSAPERDDSRWAATYRDIAGSSTIGSALLAHLMNAKADWNNPTFFDYYENRYWPIEEANRGGTNEIQLFTASMWDEHGVV